MSTTPTRHLALITGASSGIGAELAREAAKAGHDVILAARRLDKLQSLAEELGKAGNVKAHAIQSDLSQPDGPQKLLDACKERGLAPDILVNNAGFGLQGEFLALTPERQLEMTQVNCVALLALSRLIAPSLVERKWGRILNIASTAAFFPGPYMAAYYATKHFVFALSYGLDCELKAKGVRVSCLCPGPVKTEFGDVSGTAKTKLFSSGLLDARDVARRGYQGMLAGKRVIFCSWVQRLQAWTSGVFPWFVQAYGISTLQKGD